MATLPHVVRPMILTTIALSAGFILLFSRHGIPDLWNPDRIHPDRLFATDMTFLPSVVMETGMITVWDYVGLKLTRNLSKNRPFQNMRCGSKDRNPDVFYRGFERRRSARQGDMGREMFVVLDGQIRIYLEQGYETTELALLEKGTTFGEMGLSVAPNAVLERLHHTLQRCSSSITTA